MTLPSKLLIWDITNLGENVALQSLDQSKQIASRGVLFGFLITALGGLIFSFDLPLLRLAHVDQWSMIFVRGLMSFFAITAIWIIARLKSGENIPYIAGAAGIAVVCTNTIANIAYIGATVETHAANVVCILAMIPILTAIFARIFLNEPVHRNTWFACFFAFGGIAIIVWDGLQTDRFYGDFLALVCACCTAAALTIVRYSQKNIATSLAVGGLVSALLAYGFFPIDYVSLSSPAGLGVISIIWLALNGLIAIPLGSALLSNGPRFLPSVDVSMFFLLETVLTPVWIWLLFGDLPSVTVRVGGMIVIITLLAHSLWRLQQSYGAVSPITKQSTSG